MRQAGIVPAEIDFSDAAAPRATAFGDVYHARGGAAAQAGHVFLRGNGLPERWRDRGRFVILETGFGLGHNFLAAWAAWRADPRRCGTLWFASIDKHPPTQQDLRRAHGGAAADAAAAALADGWPPLLPGLHPIVFEQGRVRLLLGFGDAQAMLRELVLQADAVFLDGFAPSCNPQMWDRRLFLALPRLLAPGATAATWSVARDVRDGLASAGFLVERAPGFAGKREMTVARHAPRHVARPPAGRIAAAPRDALIVGAGLAGASAAQALAGLGIGCTVIEAGPTAAAGGSGLPAGLFHGLVHGANGAHARLLRAAVLYGSRALHEPLGSGAVAGERRGLLRLEAAGDADALARAATAALGFPLPEDYARPVPAAEASALAGVPLGRAGWWTPYGGWLHPAALVAHRLAQAGVRPILGRRVERILRLGDRWAAQDAAGRVIAAADVLVLANAADAARLAGAAAAGWRLQRLRGQVSLIAAGEARPLPRPRVPLAGAGYLIPLPDGGCLAGATSSAGHAADSADDDPSPRAADDRYNLARLAALLGLDRLPEGLQPAAKVGWRCATADRLPLIGALPHPAAGPPRPVRHRPRVAGLYTLGALGSRGITLSMLAGEILAAAITGAPLPVEASLMDAVDPARHPAAG